ncbi:uncharacterized membrane protein HdeD (DUF308 family) [Catalinimonas alkaloidigena]|uniref:hypothetical protein n=1 Tax=Catalinimonas alkaloidigena TaxID=1075417 RepID=UPI00240582CA|nr:hypothetical protein [Catalinimonas alkaloidigena]MDF9797854.1 uncharacterized membrane protein HdeD (DUF308 family) [Catalinimonas alkaloidigena]
MRKTYIFIILLSILMGIYLLGYGVQDFPQNILMWVAFVPFFLFVWGIVGLLVNFEAQQNPKFFWQIVFPVLMAILFYSLLFVHVFFLEPYLCPCLS